MPEIKYLHIDDVLLGDVCYLLLSLAHQRDVAQALTKIPLSLPQKPEMAVAMFAVLRKIQDTFGIPNGEMIDLCHQVIGGFNNAENAVEGPRRT